MIREKGEALSPAKINRNVWSDPARQVKGLFTVSRAPPPLSLSSELRVGGRKEWKGKEADGRSLEKDH
jgi:hypothetical protein